MHKASFSRILLGGQHCLRNAVQSIRRNARRSGCLAPSALGPDHMLSRPNLLALSNRYSPQSSTAASARCERYELLVHTLGTLQYCRSKVEWLEYVFNWKDARRAKRGWMLLTFLLSPHSSSWSSFPTS